MKGTSTIVGIEMTAEEATTLRAILEIDLSDLHVEVARTDSAAFRAALKEKQAFLERLIEKLYPPARQ